jgi:hypothetical protein
MVFLVVVIAAIIVVTFVVPALLAGRQDSIRAQQAFVSSGQIMPKVIQNSTISYTTGLVIFAPLFAWGVRGEPWTPVVYVAFIGLGLSLLYLLRRPLVNFLSAALINDSSVTVHEFMARRHGNDPRVRAVAAVLTVFAVSGLIICAMLCSETMLNLLLSDSVGITKLIIGTLFAVAITCTMVSGHTGIMHSSQLVLGLFYFGLFGSTTCLLYLQVSELGTIPVQGTFAFIFIAIVAAVIYFRRRVRYVDTSLIRRIATDKIAAVHDHDLLPFWLWSRFQKILNSLVAISAITLICFAIAVAAMQWYVEGAPIITDDNVITLHAAAPVFNMTLTSLILLALLHPIVDIVNWQRFAAFVKNRTENYDRDPQWTASLKSFCSTYAIEVSLIGLLISFFGAVAGLTLEGAFPEDVFQVFIARLVMQDNFVATTVVSFLLISLFAVVLATIGSLFSASLCTIRYDIMPLFWPESTPVLADVTKEKGASRWTTFAGLGIGFATYLAFYLIGVESEKTYASAKFLGLVFGFSSAQLSFIPLVVASFVSEDFEFGTLTPGWALTVMIVSSAIAFGITVIALLTGHDWWLPFVVPACLGSAASLFAIGRLSDRRTAATE